YLGIGSDMTSYIQNKKLEKMNIAKYFDAVVTSEEAGRDKPGPEIFELCAKKAGCQVEECLFIGDSEEKDYMGAKDVGMQARCYAKYSGGIKGKTKDNFNSYEEIMPHILKLCTVEK
ncbi:MAG: HAD-IA family hydrolase, partial [Hespellia sp.]|nr:HAD-IA family hydrolase [Hespellia sp.]